MVQPARDPDARRTLGRASAGLVGLVLLAAVLGKSFAPGSALGVLEYLAFPILPNALAARCALAAIVFAEGFLGLLLLLARPRYSVLAAAAAATLLLSAVLVFIALDPDAPKSCGCFGLLDIWQAGFGRPTPLFVRNAGMLALLGVAAWTIQRRPPSKGGDALPRSRPPTGGFSIIELLVCIAIIAVLLALAMPALRRSRVLAADARSLSTQRQLIASVHLYSQDYAGCFPFLATPGDPASRLSLRGGRSWLWQGWFMDQSKFWASAVVDDYFAGPRSEIESTEVRTMTAGLGYPPEAVWSMFLLTQTAFAEPAFWVDSMSHPTPPELAWLRGIRQDEITFPSSKGLLVDHFRGVYGPRDFEDLDYFLYSSADGSAGSSPFTAYDWTRVVANPFFAAMPHPILATKQGVYGRDF